MSDAITREEKLMQAIANGSPLEFEPITRREKFLKKILENGGGGGRLHWNDIEGKPFESKLESKELFNGVVNISRSDRPVTINNCSFNFVEGETYKVVVTGEITREFDCVAYNLIGMIVIGSATFIGMEGGNDEPFFIYVIEDDNVADFFCSETGSISFTITGNTEVITPLEEKYLPAKYSEVFKFLGKTATKADFTKAFETFQHGGTVFYGFGNGNIYAFIFNVSGNPDFASSTSLKYLVEFGDGSYTIGDVTATFEGDTPVITDSFLPNKIFLKSPNGTLYNVTVSDDGTLSVTGA